MYYTQTLTITSRFSANEFAALGRKLWQNGADAAALAVAQMCAAGDCGDPLTTAQQYADANSSDGSATVDELCGSGVTGASACSDPPALSGASYVRVTTSHYVSYTFGRLIGVDGNTTKARATVAWGGPSRLTSELPVTISQCEFDSYTNDNTDLKDPPPYETGYPTPEAVIYFHTRTPQHVNVHVEFLRGLLTQFYPAPTAVTPVADPDAGPMDIGTVQRSSLTWDGDVVPGKAPWPRWRLSSAP